MLKWIEQVIAALSEPVVFVDLDYRICCANHAAQELFGAHLAGQSFYAFIRQPEALHCIDDAHSEQGISETIIKHSDGEIETKFKMSVNFVDLSDTRLEGFVISLTDMSGLDATEQLRRDFVANVSHELRSPLTTMLGVIETLKGQSCNDESRRAGFIDLMEREALRMNSLIKDLLSLSKVESNERIRPSELVHISEVLNNTLSSMYSSENRYAKRIRTHNRNCNAVVRGELDQLCQVMRNLLENALKYDESGGEVLVDVEIIRQPANFNGDAVAISVSDKGPGIGPDHLPRLTERFYRVDQHRSREVGGTGLGLAIVKHIVQRHRGRLAVSSELGAGCKFTVLLPMERV